MPNGIDTRVLNVDYVPMLIVIFTALIFSGALHIFPLEFLSLPTLQVAIMMIFKT